MDLDWHPLKKWFPLFPTENHCNSQLYRNWQDWNIHNPVLNSLFLATYEQSHNARNNHEDVWLKIPYEDFFSNCLMFINNHNYLVIFTYVYEQFINLLKEILYCIQGYFPPWYFRSLFFTCKLFRPALNSPKQCCV